jgi:hypothetical protein
MKKFLFPALLSCLFAFVIGCGKEDTTTSQTLPETTAVIQSAMVTYDTLIVKNTTPCKYNYDVYACADTACCLDSVANCLYYATSMVNNMSTDSSIIFPDTITICKIVVKNALTGDSCTIGTPDCGYSPTCTDSTGCNGNPFRVGIGNGMVQIRP